MSARRFAGEALAGFGVLVLLASLFLFLSSPFNPPVIDDLQPMGMTMDRIEWDNSTGQIRAYVRNLRDSNTTLSDIYVNGKLDSNAAVVPQVLSRNQTAEITLSETYTIMPKRTKVEVRTQNDGSAGLTRIFIGFEMLRVYWNQTTKKIRVLVTNIGDYPEVNFDEVYVNGTLDSKAAITQILQDPRGYRIYEIALSGSYPTRPTMMQLKITTIDGTSFELSAPFIGVMDMNLIQWDQSTGHLKCLVYIPSAHFLEREKSITFQGIYVNETLDESAVITRPYGETYQIVFSRTYVNSPSAVTLRVVTDFGAFCVGYKTFS